MYPTLPYTQPIYANANPTNAHVCTQCCAKYGMVYGVNVVCESSVDETVNCRISVVHLVGCDSDRITMIYILQ